MLDIRVIRKQLQSVFIAGIDTVGGIRISDTSPFTIDEQGYLGIDAGSIEQNEVAIQYYLDENLYKNDTFNAAKYALIAGSSLQSFSTLNIHSYGTTISDGKITGNAGIEITGTSKFNDSLWTDDYLSFGLNTSNKISNYSDAGIQVALDLHVFGSLYLHSGEIVSYSTTTINIDDAWLTLNSGNSEVDSGIIVDIGAGESKLYRKSGDDLWYIDSNKIALYSLLSSNQIVQWDGSKLISSNTLAGDLTLTGTGNTTIAGRLGIGATPTSTYPFLFSKTTDYYAAISSTGSLYTKVTAETGSWARNYAVRDATDTAFVSFGAFGTGQTLNYLYIGSQKTYEQTQVRIYPAAATGLLTLNTNGVGINNTSPSYPIDVTGSIRTTSVLYTDSIFQNTAGGIDIYGANGIYFRNSASDAMKITSNNVTIYESLISDDFTGSGFTSSGWNISSAGAAIFNSIVVRGSLTVFELIREQMKVSGASMLFKEGAKVLDTSVAGKLRYDSEYSIFSVGNILRCQQWSPSGEVKYYQIVVATQGTETFGGKTVGYVTYTLKSGSGTPAENDFIVNVSGNLLEASSRDGGYIQIAEGPSVYTSSTFTTKLKFGNINGNTYAAKPTTATGYGIANDYFVLDDDGAYFTGRINATTGQIGSWLIDTSIYSGNKYPDAGGIEANPIDKYFSVHYNEDNFVQMKFTNNTNWGIYAKKDDQYIFKLGYENNIAGWNFNESKIYTSNIEIDSVNSIIRLLSSGSLKFYDTSFTGSLLGEMYSSSGNLHIKPAALSSDTTSGFVFIDGFTKFYNGIQFAYNSSSIALTSGVNWLSITTYAYMKITSSGAGVEVTSLLFRSSHSTGESYLLYNGGSYDIDFIAGGTGGGRFKRDTTITPGMTVRITFDPLLRWLVEEV